MRIRCGLIVSVICFLLVQSAVILLPAAASAEWSENNMCPFAPGALLPQPLYWTSEAGAPYTPSTGAFTVGAAYPEAPLPSNFTATANWGDGTTAPAIVEERLYDCYEVSAPSHAYANTGTYPFSYTVHDNKTGLDHTLDASQLHVWSDIPHLLSNPSSRIIHPTIGEPWSGVVAEFGYEGPAFPSFDEAQIEWGDGEPSEPGTISTQPNNGTFTVSGSVTYLRSFSGTINVLLLSHSGTQLGRWATSGVGVDAISTPDRVPDEKPRLRFLGQPIAAAIPRVAGHTNYEIIFRVSEQLPRTKSGLVQAQLIPYGVGSPIASFGPHESHACYAVASMRLARRHPKAGRRYPFTLATQGPRPAKIKGHAILHRYFNFVSMISEANKRLSC